VTRVAQALWAWFPVYALGLSLVLLMVAALINTATTSVDLCGPGYPGGTPFLLPVSETAIALAWVGLTVGMASMACAIVRLAARLRDPGAETRWVPGSQVTFLVFPLLVLLLIFAKLDGFYGTVAGYLIQVYCA
jgi:uncharacterized integral membrane protein